MTNIERFKPSDVLIYNGDHIDNKILESGDKNYVDHDDIIVEDKGPSL